MAGVEGFEPSHDGIKTRCLTAWLHPSKGVEHLRVMPGWVIPECPGQ